MWAPGLLHLLDSGSAYRSSSSNSGNYSRVTSEPRVAILGENVSAMGLPGPFFKLECDFSAKELGLRALDTDPRPREVSGEAHCGDVICLEPTDAISL